MPLDQETIAKLTTTLSDDIDLYNKVINELQTNDKAIEEVKTELETFKTKLTESEQRGQNYLGQISNLLSKIPVGNNHVPLSVEEKIEEIKNRGWTK